MKRSFDLVGLLLVLVGFAVSARMYPGLPDPMPTHWNVHGQVNGWMPKFWGTFIFPLVMAAMWLIFLALPRISPRGFEMEPFARAWGILKLAILGLVLSMGILVLRTAKSGEPLSQTAMFAGMGVLFVVMGNFLGKVTRNFFVGIRTPWTIASEEVWYRTHRLAGKLFMLGGLFVIAAAFFQLGVWSIIVPISLAALVPAVYSYVIYRKLEGAPAGARH